MLATIAALLLPPVVQNENYIWFAFVSDRNGNEEIYVLDNPGQKTRRFTQHPSRDIQPTVGAYGRSVAWASNRGGNWDIWMAHMDGNGATNLTDSPEANETNPVWSADGAWIFCLVDGRPHRLNPEDGSLREIAALRIKHEGRLSMHPEGETLVFRDPKKLGLQIYQTPNQIRSLTPTMTAGQAALSGYFNPSYSPEGRRIVFDSGGTKPHLYILDLDLEECSRMRFTGFGSNPIFDPFGEGVIFTAPGEGKGTDLFWLDSSLAFLGSGSAKASNLTRSPGNDRDPGTWVSQQENSGTVDSSAE